MMVLFQKFTQSVNAVGKLKFRLHMQNSRDFDTGTLYLHYFVIVVSHKMIEFEATRFILG